MKEAVVSAGPTVKIIDSPQPKPEANQVVIKVVVSGSNPKDWKVAQFTDKVVNQGDDIAGYVHEVGSDVYEFKPGDRVAAFHQMLSPCGSYGEYAVATQHATFHIPSTTSFEEAATIPLAAMTAAIGLYSKLELPAPWSPATESIPLVVYGASSAVGSFAVQLARKSNIHPIIAVCGAGAPHVETMIDRSKGDTIVDYRKGGESVVAGIRAALGDGKKLKHAYDAVSDQGSYVQVSEVLAESEQGSKITLVLPGRPYSEIPAHVEKVPTSVGASHNGLEDFAHVYFRAFARGLQEGWFKPHPHEVVPGGLEGIQTALENLKNGKASAVKYVFRIAETPGL